MKIKKGTCHLADVIAADLLVKMKVYEKKGKNLHFANVNVKGVAFDALGIDIKDKKRLLELDIKGIRETIQIRAH